METIDFKAMSDEFLWNYLCAENSMAQALCGLAREGGVGQGIIQDAHKHCNLRDSVLKELFKRMERSQGK